jgi:hypothetical protein
VPSRVVLSSVKLVIVNTAVLSYSLTKVQLVNLHVQCKLADDCVWTAFGLLHCLVFVETFDSKWLTCFKHFRIYHLNDLFKLQ